MTATEGMTEADLELLGNRVKFEHARMAKLNKELLLRVDRLESRLIELDKSYQMACARFKDLHGDVKAITTGK